jgi:hypothetical protein
MTASRGKGEFRNPRFNPSCSVSSLDLSRRRSSPIPTSVTPDTHLLFEGPYVPNYPRIPIKAICTDILHFPARVPVIQAARASTGERRDPGRVLVCRAVPVLPASPPDARAGGSTWSKQRSTLHGHAAASTDGHLSHDADRLASTRVRRATAARDGRASLSALDSVLPPLNSLTRSSNA